MTLVDSNRYHAVAYKFYKGLYLKKKSNEFEKMLSGFEKFKGNKENEGQIFNFCKHFISKNFVTNFKISRFAAFAGWFCNLDYIKVTGT